MTSAAMIVLWGANILDTRMGAENGVVNVRVKVTEDIAPGAVSLHEGVWVDLGEDGEDRAGSANVLTGTEGTGPERAAVMHGLPVEVAAAGGG